MNFSLNDLLIAYKKAKSEVFHEKLQVAILGFPVYERNLLDNLKALLGKLNSGDLDFVKKPGFNGKNIFFPIVKKVAFLPLNKVEEENVYYSSLKNRWKNKKYNIENIDFRIISNVSVEFHIISSLWIDKVAYGFERRLSPNSYGSRLNSAQDTPDHRIGHFKTYIHDYRKWQKNGLDMIRENLEKAEETVALTADIKSFYHRIDAEFLLKKEFFEEFGKNERLSEEQEYLNRLIVAAIHHWSIDVFKSLSEQTQKSFEGQSHVGIPIGLAASKVIANLVLKEFDEAVEEELMPLYYGRYVDDILIVLNRNSRITSRKTLWDYIAKRLDRLKREKKDENSLRFELSYAPNTVIFFNKEKERIFFLDKECGISILNEIERELNENSSEWRLLPDAENDLDQFSEEVVQATSDSTETANSLRKSDGISIQRLKYALFVRSAEELILSHPYYFWKKGVKDLFKVTANFVIDPDVLPNYLQYMVKILRLAVYNCDFKSLKKLCESLLKSIELLEQNFANNQTTEVSLYREYIKINIELAFYSGGSLTRPASTVDIFINNFEKMMGYVVDRNKIAEFFITDLHLVPLKNIFDQQNPDLKKYFARLLQSPEIIPFLLDYRTERQLVREPVIAEKVGSAHQIFARFIFQRDEDGQIPLAIFFLTRKMSYLEITRLLDQWLFEQKLLYKSFLSVFELHDFDVNPIGEGDYKYIKANSFPCKEKPIVAITSYEILDSSWTASVLGTLEPDGTRLKRLYALVKGILEIKDRKIDYIVLPELALPRYAINLISKQIKGSGITLIAGVDYLIDPAARTVRNQMVIVIPITINSRTHLVQIVQEKLIPAIHEATELHNKAGLTLSPLNGYKYIITKNGFTFSGLICNDFLNMDNRQAIRGKVDALFLIEWNQDIETYNSLVESTANDLHAYIIQVNNRLYGDTRIRAPFKEAHKRDVSRIRGGLLDYFVISSLDVNELRTFQMNLVSPPIPFKPVPTGFIMDDQRKLK